MNSKTIANGILRALGIILGILLVLFFLYKIQSVLVYIAIAAVISLIGRPLTIFLRRKLKFGSTLASIVTMVLFIGLLTGLISMFVPLILEQAENLSKLSTGDIQNRVDDVFHQVTDYFSIHSSDIVQSIKDSDLLSKIDFTFIPDFFNSIISGVGSLSIGLFSVLFITFFFLKDSQLLNNGVLTLIPRGKESRWKNSSTTIKDLLSRYFIGLVFQISILFIIYTVVLLIFGIPNAIVIAFLCALLNLIPYVGPLISAVLLTFLTMSSFLGESFNDVILPKTIYVLIGFVIAQLIDNFFSQPVIFSKSVKSHPLEIFLVIVIAGILFGVIGMIVAVPSYTAIKVILKEFLSDNKIVQSLTKDL